MSTTQRLGIDIVGTDKTRAAFMSAQRSVTSFSKTVAFVTGALAGIAGGNLLKNVVQSFIQINRHVEPVKTSFQQIDRAWQQFALNVGKGGMNEALINFNERIATMIMRLKGLSDLIGAGLGGAIHSLAILFEGVGRGAAFAADNISALSRVFKGWSDQYRAMTGGSKDIKVFNVDNAVLGWLDSIGVKTDAFTQSLATNHAELAKLPPTFDEIAKSAKGTESAFEKLTAIKERMFESTRTPMEKYVAGMRELDVVQASLGMSTDLYARQQARLREEFLGTGKTAQDLGTTLGDTFGDELKGMFDSALSGTFKLKDALKGLMMTLAKTGFNSFLQGSGGGGGGLGSLLGSILGKSFGGFYANGGTLGAGKWGWAGENGPEPIVGPATVIPSRPSGGFKLTIINNNGSQVTAREKTNGNGDREIIAMVDNRVAQQMSDPYARSASALKARGARPPLKQR